MIPLINTYVKTDRRRGRVLADVRLCEFGALEELNREREKETK